MPTITFSIGGEEHDISGKSTSEIMNMVLLHRGSLVAQEYNTKCEEKKATKCKDCDNPTRDAEREYCEKCYEKLWIKFNEDCESDSEEEIDRNCCGCREAPTKKKKKIKFIIKNN